jgi:hypothetical protein
MGPEENRGLQFRVGFVGLPCVPDEIGRLWSIESLERLRELGFNTVQLNVAWGSRPADEPLNLEDVVELPPHLEDRFPQRAEPQPHFASDRRVRKQATLRQRIEWCHCVGLRSIFHFGAPYNKHAFYGDNPPNCLSDPDLVQRYVTMLREFGRAFPGVDDILLYTYDQDAWLCSEFGECQRCQGIPLHERLAPFLDGLAYTWTEISPGGRLWWEPWELSAGQVLKCVEAVEPIGFGLALHGNIAECMSTVVVDRWLRNTAALAARRGIPVLAEYFLGAASEELEPLVNLAHPQVVLRGLRALASVAGVVGIKEYYGLAPDREDPNLRAAGLFFSDPTISDEEAMRVLAQPYAEAAADIVSFWTLASEGMELFPWDTSWFIREVGRSRVDHSLSAAMLRGQQCHTPSWFSTRAAIFMKTDDAQPDPWMLEDVQLRCQVSADRMGEALSLADAIRAGIPDSLAARFEANLTDLAAFRRRALAYTYHLRETNLATVLRKAAHRGLLLSARAEELLSVLRADRDNILDETSAGGVAEVSQFDDAIALLETDLRGFLARFLMETPGDGSRGCFSITSR